MKFGYLLRYYGKYKLKMIAVAALCLVSTLCSLAIPSLMSRVVDDGVKQSDLNAVISSCAAMLAVSLLALIAAVISGKLNASLSNSVARDLRDDLFKKVNSLTFEEFSSIGTSSLLTRATEDVFQLQEAGGLVSSAISVPLLLIGGIVASFTADVTLAVILLCVVPVVCAIVFALVRKMGKLWENADKYCDIQNHIVRERLYGIRVIRAFEKEDYEHARVTDATDKMAYNLVKSNLFSGLITPICSCLLSLATVALIVVGYIRATAPETTVGAGDVFAVVQYVALISSALMTTFWTLAWLPHLKVCAKRVGEVLSLKGIEKSGEPPKKLSGDLTLKGVSFRYPGAREYSLKNIDMTFPEGKTIAVIGGTGSGKSTLIKLLLDFYPVTDGEISFGNENYSSLGGSDVRANVACAMQKSMIFEGTIRDNVKIAREDATDEEVLSAIEDAQLLDFVNSQKEGPDYFLSQSGANLSGGQKQRVNIARTILKSASVYIFDDSFSALDLLTEKNLRAALNRRLKGKTQIIITQRVSTARKCDYIYVLDDGKLVGGGNHEFLIENCKTYGEIYLSQTGGYDENEA